MNPEVQRVHEKIIDQLRKENLALRDLVKKADDALVQFWDYSDPELKAYLEAKKALENLGIKT